MRGIPWTVYEDSTIKKHYKNKTSKEIAGILPNRTANAVRKRANRLGIKKDIDSNQEVRFTHSNGYVAVKEKEYPKDWRGWCNKKYVYEHYVVWWKWNPDRKPKENEIIHHMNGDRRDNRIENLQLVEKCNHWTIGDNSVGPMPEGEVFDPEEVLRICDNLLSAQSN